MESADSNPSENEDNILETSQLETSPLASEESLGIDDIYDPFDDNEDNEESRHSGSSVDQDDDTEDELPPMLEPPSTGYLHGVDENRPPPLLELATGNGSGSEQANLPKIVNNEPTEIEIWDSDAGRSSTTDSDDDLVRINYRKNPPKNLLQLLRKYKFARNKEGWMYGIRDFYNKQPSKIRRLLKMNKDAHGNPIEEPVGVLFEKIYAERDRIIKAQNIKTEVDEDLPPTPIGTVSVKIDSTDPRLTHIAYPANVVNNDKAITTLGGIKTISKIFDQPNKKLTLKFRPNDPFANGVNASGRTACGLLLKVRRRRRKIDNVPTESTPVNTTDKKINLDCLGDEPVRLEDIQDLLLDNQFLIQKNSRDKISHKCVVLDGKKYYQHDLILEDKMATEFKDKTVKRKKAWRPGDTKEYNLRVPENLITKDDPNLDVQAVGIVHRSYEFSGLCDFQYLPVIKKSDGKIVSIKDRIFPILGSNDSPEKPVCKDLINDRWACQTFIIPPAMSRIDNPPKGLMDELIATDRIESIAKKPPPDDSIFSSRLKRIIYTISYNFLVENPSPEEQDVPSQPLKLALKDIERRQIKKELIESVRSRFDERPIWSKAALEFATKIPALTLKYIIPYFAYFAANGPWRNTWIKFGLDPRKNLKCVSYQSVDFRVPFIYRKFMEDSKNAEALHKYLPECIPPKTQMFYQLCDIKLDEIKELMETLNKKADTGGLVYDERFGFLKEGTHEYFRYILTYYLENLLQEYGKIPESSKSEVSFKIPKGEIEPTSKLKAAPHRRMKVKRIRRSAKRAYDSNIQGEKQVGKKASVSKKKQTRKSSSNVYKESLEDLALNDLPNDSGNEGMELFEPDDEHMED